MFKSEDGRYHIELTRGQESARVEGVRVTDTHTEDSYRNKDDIGTGEACFLKSVMEEKGDPAMQVRVEEKEQGELQLVWKFGKSTLSIPLIGVDIRHFEVRLSKLETKYEALLQTVDRIQSQLQLKPFPTTGEASKKSNKMLASGQVLASPALKRPRQDSDSSEDKGDRESVEEDGEQKKISAGTRSASSRRSSASLKGDQNRKARVEAFTKMYGPGRIVEYNTDSYFVSGKNDGENFVHKFNNDSKAVYHDKSIEERERTRVLAKYRNDVKDFEKLVKENKVGRQKRYHTPKDIADWPAWRKDIGHEEDHE